MAPAPRTLGGLVRGSEGKSGVHMYGRAFSKVAESTGLQLQAAPVRRLCYLRPERREQLWVLRVHRDHDLGVDRSHHLLHFRLAAVPARVDLVIVEAEPPEPVVQDVARDVLLVARLALRMDEGTVEGGLQVHKFRQLIVVKL